MGVFQPGQGFGYGNTVPSPYPVPQPGYSFVPQPQPQTVATVRAMEWVVGEGGANAFPMPQGWPPNQPVVLWDSTEPKIYLKSWTAQGVPLPLQKMRYTMDDQPQQISMLPMGQSASQPPAEYVTKNDFEQLKQEIKGMMQPQAAVQNQNGLAVQNQGGNRGGRNG